MLGIVYFASDLKAEFWRIGLVLVLASAVGTSLGLAISARSSSTESAIALLPIVLLPVIVLGGGLKQIYRMPTAMQWVSTVIPSRWAFEYNIVNEAMHRNSCIELPGPCQPPTVPPQHPVATHPNPVGQQQLSHTQLWPVDAADFQVPVTVKDGQRVKPDPGNARRLGFLETLGILGSMLFVLLVSVFIFLRFRVPH
jgi:hypothetical protein